VKKEVDKEIDKGKRLRTPIVSVIGHIDHGKTSLLDNIRGTAITAKEAGGITQHIGATEIPISTIKNICTPLRKEWRGIEVPGLLFIDTPGHHAFASLRRRGSALADMAILIVDVMEGFQPQTYESLTFLRMFKTPFLVALNKIDRIKGWKSRKTPFSTNYNDGEQAEYAKEDLDRRIYEVVGELYDKGFSADRYDRLKDFSRNICIVPISARTGEGIPDLLLVLIGLSQKFLQGELHLHLEESGVATILEKKEDKGLGTTIDAILYDGQIDIGDTIVVGGSINIETAGEPIVTKVKALLKPLVLQEIKLEQSFKFEHVRTVKAASGVKIVAPGLENTLPGSQVRVVKRELSDFDAGLERALKEVNREIEEAKMEIAANINTTSVDGVIIKADTIGSLEALALELKREKGVGIKKVEVGNICKRDVIEATTVKNGYLGVILGFNVDLLPDAREVAVQNNIPVFVNDVIYRLIEDYEEWEKNKREEEKKKKMEQLTLPAKIKILEGCIFRQSKPAIVGVEVLAGKIKTGVALIKNDATSVGTINEIQDKGNNIKEAVSGMQVAISMREPTVGRQIKEKDILYVDIREKEGEEITRLKQRGVLEISSEEEKTLEDLLAIKRKMAKR
jgi:translation initiation factor 5B